MEAGALRPDARRSGLPLLAWFLARTSLPERHRGQIVALAVAGYAVLCVLTATESIAGIDPVRAPVALDAVAVAGVAAIGAAGLRTVGAARRGRSRSATGSLPGPGR